MVQFFRGELLHGLVYFEQALVDPTQLDLPDKLFVCMPVPFFTLFEVILKRFKFRQRLELFGDFPQHHLDIAQIAGVIQVLSEAS